MKLIILLVVVAWSNGAKLDRTYLPPSYAQTSGGSGNFLQTPVSGPEQYQNNGFSQGNGIAGNGLGQNDYTQENTDQSGNAFAQNGFAQSGNNFAQNNAGFDNFESRPERAQAAFERNAAILRQDTSNDGETYAYAYETENGISAEENGVATNGVEAQGGYSYTGDDGQVYSVRYTADQNGFVPQGDHLPTPPPIPEEILKALEQNARDEANGIFDDGSYSETKYSGSDNGQFNGNSDNGYNYNNNFNGNNFNAGGSFNNDAASNANEESDDEDSVVTNNALLRSNNAAPRFGNQNGIEKAYLPPFQQNAQRNPAGRYNQVQNNGFRNQPSNGVEKSYLPPEQFGQRNQNAAPNGRYNQASQPRNGFRNQAQNGVQKAYLPPVERNGQNSLQTGASFDQAQNFRNQAPRNQAPRNQGFRGASASREYLPPSENQRSSQRNGFARRPSFSARNGYQY